MRYNTQAPHPVPQLHQELIEMIELMQLMLGFVNLIILDVFFIVIWTELKYNMIYHVICVILSLFCFAFVLVQTSGHILGFLTQQRIFLRMINLMNLKKKVKEYNFLMMIQLELCINVQLLLIITTEFWFDIKESKKRKNTKNKYATATAMSTTASITTRKG